MNTKQERQKLIEEQAAKLEDSIRKIFNQSPLKGWNSTSDNISSLVIAFTNTLEEFGKHSVEGKRVFVTSVLDYTKKVFNEYCDKYGED